MTVELRDFFAANASDGDIQSFAEKVPKVRKIEVDNEGRQTVNDKAYPDNWRQIARYLHADAMIRARTNCY